MPYVPTNLDDEEEKKNQGNPEQIAGTGEGASDGAPGAQNFPSPQQSGTSGWTDVKAYLDANKNQAADLAGVVGGRLSDEAGAIENDISSGEKNFETNVNQNRVDLDQGTVDSALTDPAEFTKDQGNVDKFVKMRDADYQGPKDLSSDNTFGTLQGRINAGVGKSKLIDTEGGREQLLFDGPGNPTKGQVMLDNLLLSGAPETRDILKSGASKFGPLQNFLNEQNTAAGAYSKNAADTTANTAKTVKEKVGAAVPAFQSDLDARLADARAAATSRSGKAHDALEGVRPNSWGASQNSGAINAENVDDQTLQDLGITREQLLQMVDQRDTINQQPGYSPVDLTQFLGHTVQSPDVAIQRGNFASAADYAKAAALSKLSGGSDLNGFLNPEEIGNAGTANMDLSDIDPSQIAALQSLFESATKKPTDTNPSPPDGTKLIDRVSGPIGGDGVDDITKIIDGIKGPFDDVGKVIDDVGNGIGDGIDWVGNRIGVEPSKLPNIIANPIGALLPPEVTDPVIDTGKDISKGIGETVKSIFGGGGTPDLTPEQRQANEVVDTRRQIEKDNGVAPINRVPNYTPPKESLEGGGGSGGVDTGTLIDIIKRQIEKEKNATVAPATPDDGKMYAGGSKTFVERPTGGAGTFLEASGPRHDALEAVFANSAGASRNPNALEISDVSDATLNSLGVTRDQMMNMMKQRDAINSRPNQRPIDLTTFLEFSGGKIDPASLSALEQMARQGGAV